MGNRRYNLLNQQGESEEARLLYVSSSVYEGDWPSILHTHYFAELFYVRSGRGSFNVEGQEFPVKQDDLVIVNPNVAHTEKSVDADPLEYIVLGVEGLSFSFNKPGCDGEYSVYNFHNQREELLFYFMAMLQETERKEENYSLVCQNLLEVLFVLLMRSANYSFSVVAVQKASKECGLVKRYIDSHYAENISLDDLAEMSHLNKFYLVHAFTKYYGLSPINYLIEKRIQCSRDLLETTDHNISQIAQVSGFSSQSYFSQSFRKACGMSPGEYRKMSRQKRDSLKQIHESRPSLFPPSK